MIERKGDLSLEDWKKNIRERVAKMEEKRGHPAPSPNIFDDKPRLLRLYDSGFTCRQMSYLVMTGNLP